MVQHLPMQRWQLYAQDAEPQLQLPVAAGLLQHLQAGDRQENRVQRRRQRHLQPLRQLRRRPRAVGVLVGHLGPGQS